MASKRLSPAANLLRHSRLFSLPAPLPVPRSANPGSQNEKYSNTATLPYPIEPAIETTTKALAHGEWGMKRPLPARASHSSTPVIRVHQVDSIDHITEYDSAADHVLTVQKWHEMHIPIMVERQAKPDSYVSETTPPRSVFESQMHNTAEAPGKQRDHQNRWRFGGPWVLGMSSSEFEEFVSKGLKQRKPEFLALLREHLRQQKAQKARGRAMAAGETIDRPAELTQEEFQSGLKRLRTERHELWSLIWRFLDIPGSAPAQAPSSDSFADAVDMYLAEADGGPPKTHPSAGLSYIRTSNHMYNHPRLGPQRDRPPVRARVLSFGNVMSLAKTGIDMLGVGGVVGVAKSDGRPLDRSMRTNTNRFDDTIEGGAKAWVQPRHASIGTDGRIKLELGRATEDARAVWDHYVSPGTAFDESNVVGSMAQANQTDWKEAGAKLRENRAASIAKSASYAELVGKQLV